MKMMSSRLARIRQRSRCGGSPLEQRRLVDWLGTVSKGAPGVDTIFSPIDLRLASRLSMMTCFCLSRSSLCIRSSSTTVDWFCDTGSAISWSSRAALAASNGLCKLSAPVIDTRLRSPRSPDRSIDWASLSEPLPSRLPRLFKSAVADALVEPADKPSEGGDIGTVGFRIDFIDAFEATFRSAVSIAYQLRLRGVEAALRGRRANLALVVRALSQCI